MCVCVCVCVCVPLPGSLFFLRVCQFEVICVFSVLDSLPAFISLIYVCVCVCALHEGLIYAEI